MATNHLDFIRNSGTIAFKGRKDILSNFYPCPIYYKNKWFNCVEQAYQWEKANFHNCAPIADLILVLNDPYVQKLATRPIDCNHEWMTTRVHVMKNILKCKLDCVLDYKQLLLHSKGVIVEAVVNEGFWSSGLSKENVFLRKRGDWPGQNMLGKLHMELRDELHSVRNLLLAQTPRMVLNCSSQGIENISVNTNSREVTVYAKSESQAYAFTDNWMIPRIVVRVLIR